MLVNDSCGTIVFQSIWCLLIESFRGSWFKFFSENDNENHRIVNYNENNDCWLMLSEITEGKWLWEELLNMVLLLEFWIHSFLDSLACQALTINLHSFSLICAASESDCPVVAVPILLDIPSLMRHTSHRWSILWTLMFNTLEGEGLCLCQFVPRLS